MLCQIRKNTRSPLEPWSDTLYAFQRLLLSDADRIDKAGLMIVPVAGTHQQLLVLSSADLAGARAFLQAARIPAWIHSTYSHKENDPRFRVLIPLATAVEVHHADDAARALTAACSALKIPGVGGDRDRGRGWFAPHRGAQVYRVGETGAENAALNALDLSTGFALTTLRPLPADRATIFADIVKERARQDEKFPDQGDLPDDVPHDHDYGHGMMAAKESQRLCENATVAGKLTWTHVLVEEVAEAVEAAQALAVSDGLHQYTREAAHLREELVQVAAVAVKWIEHLDRRPR